MSEVRVMGVVGGGQMGSGIAQVAATSGVHVRIHDTDPDALIRASKSITLSLHNLLSKSSLSQEEVADIQRRIRYVSNLEDLSSADVIIEAVAESELVKTCLFSELDKLAKPSTVFASNTSSISITSLASATSRPTQVIGMHFMNPAPTNRLVEVIRGSETSEATLVMIKGLAERFGKTVICSRDFPGFIVNRILMPMINEAFHALYTGVATKEDIDTGMKLGTRHPMGPFELADFIGLDICVSILQVLHHGLGDDREGWVVIERLILRRGRLCINTGCCGRGKEQKKMRSSTASSSSMRRVLVLSIVVMLIVCASVSFVGADKKADKKDDKKDEKKDDKKADKAVDPACYDECHKKCMVIKLATDDLCAQQCVPLCV